MRHIKIRSVVGAALAGLMLAQSAAALGTEQFAGSVPLGEGIELHETVFDYDGRQEEHYITYTPNETVVPVMVYGSKLLNYGRFDSMAALIENTGRNVIGGVNGDFYGVGNYQPVGIVVSDGIIRCSDGGFNAVGFFEDGSVIMGKPELNAYARLQGLDHLLYGINTGISDAGMYLYTEDYAAKTRFGVPTVNVVLAPTDDKQLRMNSYLDMTVEEIIETDQELELATGKMLLSMTQSGPAYFLDLLRALKPGDALRISVNANKDWTDVQHAVGGLYRLLDQGVIQPDIDDNQIAPRTSLGLRPDGTLVMYTVDGRQSGYSAGLKVSDMARRLLELGCTEACLLDGGGSTNLHVRYVGDNSSSQVNSPCYGERSVTNYIMLAATGEGSGEARTAVAYPAYPVVLCGTPVSFTMRAADEAGNPVELTEAASWSVTGTGSVDGEGVFKAETAGNATLTGTVSGLKDSAEIIVISSPEAIALYQEGSESPLKSVSLYNGDEISLLAESTYFGREVFSIPEAYTWSVEGNIGSVDEKGVFTAGEHSGRGVVKVSAGSTSKSVEVTVKSTYQEIEGFESYLPAAAGMEQESAKDHVRFGQHSLRLMSDGLLESIFYPYSAALDPLASFVSLWVAGDGGSGSLSLVMGSGEEIPLTELSAAGWQQIIVPVANRLEGRREIAGFRLTGAGSCWIDQLVSSTGADPDSEPPTVYTTYENEEVRALISDDRDESFTRDRITVSYDGVDIEFAWEAENGRVRIPARSLEPGHRISVTVRDQSGNLSTSALWLPEPPEEQPEPEEGAETEPIQEPEEEPVQEQGFTDVEGHWAKQYVDYMAGQGVVNGVGAGLFDPNSPVTRAQCAVMVARWLRLDTAAFADEELPFVDAERIPAWASDAVKAIYSLGVIAGKQEPGGLYFAPDDPLSREQAMTIIGRIQARGYYLADLSFFRDNASVQSWSRTYLEELVGRGVINGYDDGTLRPGAPVTRAQLCKILTEVR